MTEPLHPLRWLPQRSREILFLLALVGTVTVMCILGVLGRGLETRAAPYGILLFEFAGDLATAQRIVDSWGGSGSALAGFHLGLDYLFLVFYPTFIALGCAFAIVYFLPGPRVLAYFGVALGWGQIFAGLLDAVENWALYCLLSGATYEQLPRVAWWCAAGKFALVVAGLSFLLVAAVLALIAANRE